jgi:serine/threonine-protein kinase RsbT
MAEEEWQLTLRDESDLVGVRRHVRELGEQQGLSNVAIEAFATAVTEIARNVLVHAHSGQIQLRAGPASQGEPPRAAVLVVVKDQGPGIANLDAAMRDGFTTGQGLGIGLPSARRLVDVFEVDSRVGEGTTIRLEKWGRRLRSHL